MCKTELLRAGRAAPWLRCGSGRASAWRATGALTLVNNQPRVLGRSNRGGPPKDAVLLTCVYAVRIYVLLEKLCPLEVPPPKRREIGRSERAREHATLNGSAHT